MERDPDDEYNFMMGELQVALDEEARLKAQVGPFTPERTLAFDAVRDRVRGIRIMIEHLLCGRIRPKPPH